MNKGSFEAQRAQRIEASRRRAALVAAARAIPAPEAAPFEIPRHLGKLRKRETQGFSDAQRAEVAGIIAPVMAVMAEHESWVKPPVRTLDDMLWQDPSAEKGDMRGAQAH